MYRFTMKISLLGRGVSARSRGGLEKGKVGGGKSKATGWVEGRARQQVDLEHEWGGGLVGCEWNVYVGW